MLQTTLPLHRLLLIVAVFQVHQLFAQTVSGRVTSEDNEPIVGASVFWLKTAVGTATDQQGYYEIGRAGEENSFNNLLRRLN